MDRDESESKRYFLFNLFDYVEIFIYFFIYFILNKII